MLLKSSVIQVVKELFLLLSPVQRKRFYKLQILVFFMAVMELFGIASIGPFMALVADPQLVKENYIAARLFDISGVGSTSQFLFLMGLCVLLTLALASIISIVTTWRLSLFAMQIGTEISDRLYSYYLSQSWLFHVERSSPQLIKNVTTESLRVTNFIILPLTQLNARAVLAVVVSVAIVFYSPIVALVGLAVFLAGYFFIYKLVRRRLAYYGELISDTNAQRFRLMNEGFGGIKDLLLLNRSQYFINQFDSSGKKLARAQGINGALSQVPRYFMEFIAFGAMLVLILVLLKIYDGALIHVLPILAVYALAGFKLLPSFQRIYAAFSQIKGNTAAFEAIKNDLRASQKNEPIYQDDNQQLNAKKINIKNSTGIYLNNVSFTYPGSKTFAVNGVTLTIPLNTAVAFVGESGSGKSTLIDMVLGLIHPVSGELMLDETLIDKHNIAAWQANIGFVPQNIFLGEGSIAENIAFGIEASDIDYGKVKKAIALAQLEELVNSLPGGLETKVGERGVKLSGGQRQRIGIARALYSNASVLIFDEATNALDGITEKIIMDSIHKLSDERTVILIAHRLKTVQQCSRIFLMDKGRLVDQGSYIELLERNDKFNKMASFG